MKFNDDDLKQHALNEMIDRTFADNTSGRVRIYDALWDEALGLIEFSTSLNLELTDLEKFRTLVEASGINLEGGEQGELVVNYTGVKVFPWQR